MSLSKIKEKSKTEWIQSDLADLINRLKENKFSYSAIVAEYLAQVIQMEQEDKEKSGPYLFPK